MLYFTFNFSANYIHQLTKETEEAFKRQIIILGFLTSNSMFNFEL